MSTSGEHMNIPSTRLLWAVHCHQPVGNFDFVFEHAFDNAYRPFVDVLESHPLIGVDFHFSGILLDWLDKHRPQYLDRVAALVARGQCGILAGAYYEPILPPIPRHDQVGQVVALRKRLKERFGVDPKGMWLAERVWEPGLPEALAEAGIEFTLLDGTHFKQVGFSEEDLFGRWLTESEGQVVSVFPIHDGVRDLIPFSDVERAVQALRDLAVVGGRDVVFGDDGEKFGDWPGTHQLCYDERWLDRFFQEIGKDESLSVRPVSEAFGTTKARGMAYLPAASYFEMMEWAERAGRQSDLRKARTELKDAQTWEGIAPFVRGVSWRNFLVRYPESNRMHKMASRLSRLIRQEMEGKPGARRRSALLDARDHVWQAQCNCGYWHGVFGGLYLPHLRRAIHGHLARAESILRDGHPALHREDWDLDGSEEVLLASGGQFLSVHPGQGGSIPVWYLDRAGLNLADSMTRTPEAYHARVRGDEGKSDGGKLADQFEGADPELAASLAYDSVPRASGLVWWVPGGTDAASVWQGGRDPEHWLGGSWEVLSIRRGLSPSCELRLVRDGLIFRRGFKLSEAGGEAILLVENTTSQVREGTVGLEWMVNLLAGDAHDRWLETPDGTRHKMGSKGSCQGQVLRMADEWLGLTLALESDAESEFLWEGVHTVNQSVGGYEKVYQGTSLVNLRHISIPPGGMARIRVGLDILQPEAPAPL